MWHSLKINPITPKPIFKGRIEFISTNFRKQKLWPNIIIKYKANGSVDRYKVWLVDKGFTQSYGIDYQETFVSVAKLNTIHVLLLLVINQDWPLHQLDIKKCLLNGDLEEEVYMEIPLGLKTESSNLLKLGLSVSPRL